jgi:hypothetical protein
MKRKKGSLALLARSDRRGLDLAGQGGNEPMEGLWERAIEKFNHRSARVGVLGLGYAGLPLTCCFAEAGFETFGFDVDRSTS